MSPEKAEATLSNPDLSKPRAKLTQEALRELNLANTIEEGADDLDKHIKEQGTLQKLRD